MGTATLQPPGIATPSERATAREAARAAERADDARLVAAVRAGDPNAFGALYDRWFDRVFQLCRRIVRDQEVARETTQDAFLAAWRGLGELRDPGTFGGWLLRIARNKSLNRWERERRSSSVDDMSTVLAVAPTAGPAGFSAEDRAARATDPAAVAEDAELVALIDDAAAALGPRDATVLDLHLRHGLEPQELAGALGVSHNAAKQVVHRVRRRLGDAIRARVLWRGGRPGCGELATALDTAGLSSFGPDAARAINRHARACGDCTRRQESRLSPAKLFGAVPVGVTPVLLKQKTALALAAADVPMTGSQALGHGGRAGRLTRRLAKVGATGGVVAAVVVAVLVLAEADVDEIDGSATSAFSPPTTLVPTEPSAADAAPPEVDAVPEPEPDAAPTTTRPRTATAPAPGPAPTSPPGPAALPPPPPPPPAIQSFGLSPSTIRRGGLAPTLAWSVNPGAGSVAISGPGIASSAFSGSQTVCPIEIRNGECWADAGSYPYTLRVYDAGGTLVDQRTATLTITIR